VSASGFALTLAGLNRGRYASVTAEGTTATVATFDPRSPAAGTVGLDTIFISIAAYRDPDLAPTLEDCLAKARSTMSERPDPGGAFEKVDPSRRQFLKYLAAVPFAAPVLLGATEAKAANAPAITSEPTPSPHTDAHTDPHTHADANADGVAHADIHTHTHTDGDTNTDPMPNEEDAAHADALPDQEAAAHPGTHAVPDEVTPGTAARTGPASGTGTAARTGPASGTGAAARARTAAPADVEAREAQAQAPVAVAVVVAERDGAWAPYEIPASAGRRCRARIR
jgi:hypothetical protein